MRSRPRKSNPFSSFPPVGRSHLRLIRDSAPSPPLPLPRADVRGPWWDSAGVGWAITISLLGGAVLIALALGWIR